MRDLSLIEPIAVTGATGFIGTHLVRGLLRAGFRPVLLARAPDEKLFADFGDVQWVNCDLVDADRVGEVIRKERPSTIFHLAGTRGRKDARSAAAACDELNFQATAGLLEAASEAGIRRVVLTGSAEEYGDQQGPLDDSSPTRPTTPYGISKAKATRYALAMHARNAFPVVVVRPFSVYGPGQPMDMFIAEAVDAAVCNVEFKMSRGEQKRDLIFVEDVVRGLISAARAKDAEGRTINLGSGQARRLRDVAELIWEMAGAKAPLLVGARSASQGELHDTWADIALARRLLEWEPRIDLQEGLRRTIDAARNRVATRAQACQVM